MTPAELLALEESHRAAQARLGLLAAYLSQRIWLENNGGPNWLAVSLLIIIAVRKKSRRLAKAYIQYARALELGRTLGTPEALEDGDTVHLGDLREAYFESLEDIAEIGFTVDATDPDERELEELAMDYPPDPKAEGRIRDWSYLDVDIETYIDEWEASTEGDDQRPVQVDEFDWSEIEELLDEMQDSLEEVLQRDVLDHGDEMVKRLEDSRENIIDFEARRKEQEEKNSSLGAGRVDRYSTNDSREMITQLIPRDNKIKGVARGLGPNPCSFCTMLASRGFVYRTTSSAVAAGADSIKRYHDNCHCYPIVRWLDASELPVANSWLQSQWPIVTRGKPAKEARKAWRHWWEKEGRKQYGLLLNTQSLEKSIA